MSLLALDFDGVICDSAVECLVNSYNSFNIFKGYTSQKVYNLKEICAGYIETFRKFRPLVRVAKEYYALWYLIRMNQPIDPNTSIRKQAKVGEENLDRFNSIFYGQRQEWMESNINSWLDYNPLYGGIKKALSKISDKENMLIVSSKDKSAIKAILQHNGLSIDDPKVWSSDSGMDKDEIFRKLGGNYSINLSNITFLDDNLNNLIKAKGMGIAVFFASWGYSMENEKKQVHEMGIPIVALEDFENWVMDIV